MVLIGQGDITSTVPVVLGLGSPTQPTAITGIDVTFIPNPLLPTTLFLYDTFTGLAWFSKTLNNADPLVSHDQFTWVGFQVLPPGGEVWASVSPSVGQAHVRVSGYVIQY